MYEGREVYPNSPLEFVAAEIRFPFVPKLRSGPTQSALIEALADILPRSSAGTVLSVALGPEGASLGQPQEGLLRLFDAQQRMSVQFTPTSVTVESTAYREFADFLSLILRALETMTEVSPAAGVERVGLRYVDEIRVPEEIKTVSDWREWLNPDLISSSLLKPDYPTSMWQQAIQYQTGLGQFLSFRSAAVDGPSVIGNDPLRKRHQPPPGPFFVLDYDSFWLPGDEGLKSWDVDWLRALLVELHSPIGALFNGCLTERLKDEVFRIGG